ncbi:MAG: FkbM family methyltransferase [Rhodospirillaceae bacterium]|jgi:FkbM family methyltransferase|nr:FkbM family methyltransferase [Rhodospirillales bacterium]MBT3906468.1 FkbM family methyltransferase [Rhodospirillaceae bacterium]MBT4703455.1 FkbM family methyltransferase [Rhodospirillaceae bacterium]MBT5034281.1 FkbM family methyltransferase [Rhodospirillaceae bacterium]MBT6218146.1 FkbM family methyltransferase [Rhodospirillaceae bacterium]
MNGLPNRNFRDIVNSLRMDFKFRYVPFRGYYRYRSYKYRTRKSPEMGLLQFLCSGTKASVDVGANLGLYTYYLSRYSPVVYAFEPNPYPFRILKHVIDKNVKLEHAALTETSGEVELIVPHHRKGWSSNGAGLDREKEGDFVVVKVPGHRLDDLDLGDIGFIKIDTEGHEMAVLKGAQKTLETHRPNLFVEIEELHLNEKDPEIMRYLKDLNYDGFFLMDGVLTSIAKFSTEQFQDKDTLAQSGHRYIKDFIFMPR